MELLEGLEDFHFLDLGGLDFLQRIALGVLGEDVELLAAFGLHHRERIQLKNGEGGEIAWGGTIIPLDIARIKTSRETVGETCIGMAEPGHLALYLFFGHAGSITVDDGQIGRGDVLCGGVAVGGRSVEHKTTGRGVPFLCLIFLPRLLLLDEIELLALDLVLILSLLGGTRHSGRDRTK